MSYRVPHGRWPKYRKELQNDSIGIGTVGVGPRADPNFGPARGPAPTMPNDKGKFIRSIPGLLANISKITFRIRHC